MVGSNHVPAGSYTIFRDTEQRQVDTHHQQEDGRMGYRLPGPLGRSGANRHEGVGAALGRRELHYRLRQDGQRLHAADGLGDDTGIRGNFEDVALFGKGF